MSYIQLKQLTKQYKGSEIPAVNHIELDIQEGEIISLLGPSGCGKTTTLRMIAGFEQPTSGSIVIADREVYGRQSYVPPEKRGIGMVFQDYALFPHLTIEKNVVFGLLKWNTRAKRARAAEVLELVGLADYGKRYPNELSGGQQQRVALARALAPSPHVVLMDEPFSNLDAGLRERMRYDITTILRKANSTAIIVTHDQKDALAVSDRVVVMKKGVIQQVATPREMYRCPKNCFVAQFVGKTNLLTGTLCNDLKHVDTHIGRVCLPTHTEDKTRDVRISVRPEGCQLVENGRYSGQVRRVTYSGKHQEVEVDLGEHDLSTEPMTVYAPVEQEIEVGSVIFFDINSDLVALVEA